MSQKWKRFGAGRKARPPKVANIIFASDGLSNAIVYSRADILRREDVYDGNKF